MLAATILFQKSAAQTTQTLRRVLFLLFQLKAHHGLPASCSICHLSMSGVFLFRRQKNAPPPAGAPVTAPAEKKGDVPAAPVAAGTSVPTTAAAAVPGTPAAPATAPVGELLTVKTDLFTAKINTVGGVIEEVALNEHKDAADKSKPYYVLMKNKDRTHIAQSGLIALVSRTTPRPTAKYQPTPTWAVRPRSRCACPRRIFGWQIGFDLHLQTW